MCEMDFVFSGPTIYDAVPTLAYHVVTSIYSQTVIHGQSHSAIHRVLS